MNNDFFFWGGNLRELSFFIQKERKLKVKLENCLQIHKRKKQRRECIVLHVHWR